MLLPFLLAATLLAQTPSAPSSAPKPAAPPPNLEAYQLVILQRPEHPREYPQDKLEEIQPAPPPHLRELARAGKLLVPGPLDGQPDPRMRGIEIFRVGSLEEAKRLAGEEPAGKAGRLEPVVMTWYTEKGALAFPVAEKLRKGN